MPIFEQFLFNSAEKLNEIKRTKKKSIWSFFSPGTNNAPKGKDLKDNEITDVERLQFNIAEFCFLTGNYETASLEFKNLAQVFAVV